MRRSPRAKVLAVVASSAVSEDEEDADESRDEEEEEDDDDRSDPGMIGLDGTEAVGMSRVVSGGEREGYDVGGGLGGVKGWRLG